MSNMLNLGLTMLLLTFFCGCNGQKDHHEKLFKNEKPPKNIVGGPFENGEFIYVDMPAQINSKDTSAGWGQDGQKILISGTIYKLDGKTPASNVVLYYYHTDISGRYSSKKGLSEKARKHGYIRGWVKSNQQGEYSIYTVRPAPYPDHNEPAHIHLTVKEPYIENEYYIDSFVFDDDILLKSSKRKAMQNRGGSGVLRILKSDDLQIAEKDIILGLNIPNYPEKVKTTLDSGKNIGEDIFSFTPYHAWGPDKGKITCPVCKYGRYHGVLYFVGNKPDWNSVKSWLSFLEKESIKRGKYLKVYFIYGNENDFDKEKRSKELAQIGAVLDLRNVALTFVPSFSDKKSEVDLNRINPEVQNTFLIYRNRNVVEKFVNLKPGKSNFDLISKRLDETKGEYFDLAE